jgi:hypothetical protein
VSERSAVGHLADVDRVISLLSEQGLEARLLAAAPDSAGAQLDGVIGSGNCQSWVVSAP